VRVGGARADVPGIVAGERNESAWRFAPLMPWTAGAYRLIVDNGLEDLAGNKIGQPFDIDVFDKVTERITTSTTAVPFEIR